MVLVYDFLILNFDLKNGALKYKQATERATEKYFWATNQHQTKKFRQNHRLSDSNLLEISESVGWREMKIFVIAALSEFKQLKSFVRIGKNFKAKMTYN